MNNLRTAREFCFQYFFHLQLPVFNSLREDYQNEGDSKMLFQSIQSFKESTNTLLDDSANRFIESQILSTIKNYKQSEEIISAHLKNWKFSRLSKVDQTNLILAVTDLCFIKSASHNVIINEAIEISKKFGSLESSSFVNGVLDNIAKSNAKELK